MSEQQIAQEELGAQQFAGGLYRNPPTVTVTAPIGPVGGSTVTVTWTYSSDIGKPQVSYRVRILNQTGVATLFDSGTIAGADVTYDCPFLLSPGSAYRVRVDCSDGVDVGASSVEFSATDSTVPEFAVGGEVGTVYDVAINGVGYVLADSPERPYQRQTGTLQAPRLATGDTPFSEAIERYSYVGSGDWTGGAGQRRGDREGSSPSRFRSSESVNPFEPGEVSLLNATSEQVASALAAPAAVVASGDLFVQTATDALSRLQTVDGTPSAFTFTGDTIGDVTSDGTHWYVGMSNVGEVFRGTDTTPGSVWADLSAQTSAIDLVEWSTDRLSVVYTDASSQSVLSTVGPAGTEEVAGGRFKFDGASIVEVAAGDGYLWFAVDRNGQSTVHAWQLGSADEDFVALQLPTDESVTGMGFYLGNVMVRTSSGSTTRIYRCVPSAGVLTPDQVAEFEDSSSGRFVGQDRFVFWSWKAMASDGRSGVGCLDLSTGGWAKWLRAAAADDTGDVAGLYVWDGKLGFTVGGAGAMLTDDALEPSGFLESSVFDMASTLRKVLDAAEVTSVPLPASVSVTVDVSIDDGSSFSEVGSFSTPGLRGGEFAIGWDAPSFAYRLTLTASGSQSPVVRIFQMKLHPLSVADMLVQLPIDCHRRQVGLNGVPLSDVPSGMERARTLENLVGTQVVLQDVDFPVSGETEVWEMVSAEFTSVGTFQRSKGRRVEQTPVCVVTLRRAL